MGWKSLTVRPRRTSLLLSCSTCPAGTGNTVVGHGDLGGRQRHCGSWTFAPPALSPPPRRSAEPSCQHKLVQQLRVNIREPHVRFPVNGEAVRELKRQTDPNDPDPPLAFHTWKTSLPIASLWSSEDIVASPVKDERGSGSQQNRGSLQPGPYSRRRTRRLAGFPLGAEAKAVSAEARGPSSARACPPVASTHPQRRSHDVSILYALFSREQPHRKPAEDPACFTRGTSIADTSCTSVPCISPGSMALGRVVSHSQVAPPVSVGRA